MSKKSSTHGKTTDERPDPYRSRPADDGGMYLLLPRDEHLIPPLPPVAGRVGEIGAACTLNRPR